MDTTASAGYSFAIGEGTTASGLYSFATGFGTTASQKASAAFGYSTTAMNYYAAAFGISTTASGNSATSFGRSTLATGDNSISTGEATTANSFCSVVLGVYNVGHSNTGGTPNLTSWTPADPLLELGNGTSTGTPSDAFVVYKDGSAVIQGPLTASSGVVTTPASVALTDIPMFHP